MSEASNLVSSYKITKKIGKGATSTVKLALDLAQDKQVAIKILNSSTSERNEDFVEDVFNYQELFDNEIEAMNLLNDKHPGLVQMIDNGSGTYTSTKGTQEKVRFMVFEYIDGACLHSFLNSELCKFDEPLTQHFFKQFID